jgi:hypothetical protein
LTSNTGDYSAGLKPDSRTEEEITMTKPNVHVVPKDNNWAVKRANSDDPEATFQTQEEAIESGRQLARAEKVEFILHGEDGRVRLRDSYGNDPRNVPG